MAESRTRKDQFTAGHASDRIVLYVLSAMLYTRGLIQLNDDR